MGLPSLFGGASKAEQAAGVRNICETPAYVGGAALPFMVSGHLALAAAEQDDAVQPAALQIEEVGNGLYNVQLVRYGLEHPYQDHERGVTRSERAAWRAETGRDIMKVTERLPVIDLSKAKTIVIFPGVSKDEATDMLHDWELSALRAGLQKFNGFKPVEPGTSVVCAIPPSSNSALWRDIDRALALAPMIKYPNTPSPAPG